MPEAQITEGEMSETSKEEPLVTETSATEGILEVFPLETLEAQDGRKEGRLEGRYQEILTSVVKPAVSGADTDTDATLDAQTIQTLTLDEESKIQKILDLAETKGVAYAVKVAQALDDYYALDQVHDALADKLYEGLLARGLIQKD